ncbi:AAA family ATPase [Candidatus Saccharibacteria bacterium]|nr:AAA family ATPase [Candidatus Saccharibacteria bacterium]
MKNPEHIESPPTQQGNTVADRLCDLLSSEEAAPSTPEVEVTESQLTQSTDTIQTADEYFEAEVEYHLDKYYLAHAYDTYHRQLPGSGGDTESVRERTLARPDWEAHFPADTSGSEDWDAFVAQYPENMQISLNGLLETHRRIEEAKQKPELMQEVERVRQEKHEIRQAGIVVGAVRRMMEPLKIQNRDLVLRAAALDAPLSEAQRSAIKANSSMLEKYEGLQAEALSELESQDQIMQALEQVQTRAVLRDRSDLANGIVETPDMQAIIDRHLPSLLSGGKLLLVGETGGAKTALAKHLTRKIMTMNGHSPDESFELVSAFGDTNAYQLIGKQELVLKDGATVTEFAFGAISRAMVEGKPIIIDEINAMPPEILKRLNEILQLKPGARYKLQENGGQEVVIKEGFCIIATANDKKPRYKGVEKLSAELRNRFMGATERVSYPDDDVLQGKVPPQHLRLAIAALADRTGEVALERYGITIDELVNLLKAAVVTQRLFTEQATAAYAAFVSDAQIRDGKTGLAEEVISPRAVVAFLKKIQESGGSVSLKELLTAYVDSIEDGSTDARVMRNVLENYHLIDSKDNSTPGAAPNPSVA